jgi:hypothetical protein
MTYTEAVKIARLALWSGPAMNRSAYDKLAELHLITAGLDVLAHNIKTETRERTIQELR